MINFSKTIKRYMGLALLLAAAVIAVEGNAQAAADRAVPSVLAHAGCNA